MILFHREPFDRCSHGSVPMLKLISFAGGKLRSHFGKFNNRNYTIQQIKVLK